MRHENENENENETHGEVIDLVTNENDAMDALRPSVVAARRGGVASCLGRNSAEEPRTLEDLLVRFRERITTTRDPRLQRHQQRMTFEVFRDPVVAPSGNSYERQRDRRGAPEERRRVRSRHARAHDQDLDQSSGEADAAHAWLNEHAWAYADIDAGRCRWGEDCDDLYRLRVHIRCAPRIRHLPFLMHPVLTRDYRKRRGWESFRRPPNKNLFLLSASRRTLRAPARARRWRAVAERGCRRHDGRSACVHVASAARRAPSRGTRGSRCSRPRRRSAGHARRRRARRFCRPRLACTASTRSPVQSGRAGDVAG